jgi:hypothetical protein
MAEQRPTMSKKALTTAMLLQAILPIAVPKRYLGVPDRDKLELGQHGSSGKQTRLARRIADKVPGGYAFRWRVGLGRPAGPNTLASGGGIFRIGEIGRADRANRSGNCLM